MPGQRRRRMCIQIVVCVCVCLDAFGLCGSIPKKNSTGMLCALAENGPSESRVSLGKSALDCDRDESS